MILLFGGEKGGTGKTTLAVNLAALLAIAGKDVLLVDTDKQGSANFWAGIRDEVSSAPRVPCIQKMGKGLAREVLDLAGRYDEIILDAGGRDSMELRYSLGVADRVYIPVQPTQFDLATLEQMAQLVEQAQALNSKLGAYVVINRASTNPAVSDAEEAKALVEEFDRLATVGTILHERVAYQRSVREGLSVVEVSRPDTKAAEEIRSFFREVYHDEDR